MGFNRLLLLSFLFIFFIISRFSLLITTVYMFTNIFFNFIYLTIGAICIRRVISIILFLFFGLAFTNIYLLCPVRSICLNTYCILLFSLLFFFTFSSLNCHTLILLFSLLNISFLYPQYIAVIELHFWLFFLIQF